MIVNSTHHVVWQHMVFVLSSFTCPITFWWSLDLLWSKLGPVLIGQCSQLVHDQLMKFRSTTCSFIPQGMTRGSPGLAKLRSNHSLLHNQDSTNSFKEWIILLYTISIVIFYDNLWQKVYKKSFFCRCFCLPIFTSQGRAIIEII